MSSVGSSKMYGEIKTHVSKFSVLSWVPRAHGGETELTAAKLFSNRKHVQTHLGPGTCVNTLIHTQKKLFFI